MTVFVNYSCNPDIVVGYEIQMLSWGYVIQRAATLTIDLPPLLSRIPGVFTGRIHILYGACR